MKAFFSQETSIFIKRGGSQGQNPESSEVHWRTTLKPLNLLASVQWWLQYSDLVKPLNLLASVQYTGMDQWKQLLTVTQCICSKLWIYIFPLSPLNGSKENKLYSATLLHKAEFMPSEIPSLFACSYSLEALEHHWFILYELEWGWCHAAMLFLLFRWDFMLHLPTY
jgi:hypothetical protein